MFRLVGGDSGAIRTPDRLLRRQMLYPAELRNRKGKFIPFSGNLGLVMFFTIFAPP